mgnify:CR=1 FL=1
MAYTDTESLRVGEKKPLYAEVSVTSGTITVATPTMTLYKSDGTTVTGLVDVTAQNGSAAATVDIWYNLDTSSAGPAGALTAGIYVAVFKYTATPSVDSIGRIDRPTVQVEILSVVEVKATFDPALSAARDVLRMWVRDTDVTDPTWSNAELDYFIAQATVDTVYRPYRAIYLTLFNALIDAARLASIEKIGVFMTNTKSTADAIRDVLKDVQLLDAQFALPVTISTTAIYDRNVLATGETLYDPSIFDRW